MDTGKITSWIDQAQPILVTFGLKALGAVAVFVVDRWPINLVDAGMTRHKLGPAVQRYQVSFITVALNIIQVVAILGYFGVETTSFAALVAGAGVAWSGMLGACSRADMTSVDRGKPHWRCGQATKWTTGGASHSR